MLGSQASNPAAPVRPFTNCVVVGDAIDPATTTLFVQPATYTAAEGDSPETASTAVNRVWGTSLTALTLALTNKSVPLILRPGAQLTVPNSSTRYTIEPGDTWESAARGLGLGPTALIQANTTTKVLITGAQLQLAPGTLRPMATSAQGVTGFTMVRDHPDPDNQPHHDLTPAQTVSALFNLIGYATTAGGTFLASGAGLPTTPADSAQHGTDGLRQRDLSQTRATEWNYHQSLAVAPFGTTRHGSASPALPRPADSPYAGIACNDSTGKLSTVTLALTLQDIHGNRQPPPTPYTSLTVPVGYHDEVTPLASWPSLAAGYRLTTTASVAVAASLSMHGARYLPSPTVDTDSAFAAIRADLAAYTRIHHQLAQPDLTFTLATSLAVQTGTAQPVSHPVAKPAFAAFARSAYVYLAALATMAAEHAVISGTTTTLTSIADAYGTGGGALLRANADQPYHDVFGTTTIIVPQIYCAVTGDTLASIATRWSSFHLDAVTLVQRNTTVPLAPGAAVTTPSRTITAGQADSLHGLATAASASVAGIAKTNQGTALRSGVTLAYRVASHLVTGGDTLATTADLLGTSVSELANANAWITAIFPDDTTLAVDEAVATAGDTWTSLAAAFSGGDLADLAQRNADTTDVFAPGTALTIGTKTTLTPASPGDTLTTYATANGVTVAQLGDANTATYLADNAKLLVPGTVSNASTKPQYCGYRAAADDTLTSIARRFGVTPQRIAELNPDLPGLLLPGQQVTDSGSGTAVTTGQDATFAALISAFRQQHGVELDLARLAADMADQIGLLTDGDLWICPPMTGDAHGANPDRSLAGLAAAYHTDVVTLAEANAAVLGVLASGISLEVGAAQVTTGALETFHSLVARFAAQGVQADVATLARTFEAKTGLVRADAQIAPVPPHVAVPEVAITPAFATPVFPITMDIALQRDPRLVDPQFSASPTVAAVLCPVAPEPSPGTSGGLALTDYAKSVETALPGVHIATGDPHGEDDPPTARTVWAVNLGNPSGPDIGFTFHPRRAQYFSMPPLSTSLLGGTVDITPYVSDSGLVGPATPQTFQAVDLEGWLSTFAEAVDTFLAPPYALPAYTLEPRAATEVVAAKRTIAGALAARTTHVFRDGGGGSQTDAAEAVRQVLLNQLASGTAIAAVVQIPVTVTSPYTDPHRAPRLFGQPMGQGQQDSPPSAYSFSTASVSLAGGAGGEEVEATASFLLSVKTPADHKSATLDLCYAINALELPCADPAVMDADEDYRGSRWLTFVNQASELSPSLGRLEIPVPLRSYPGPVTLIPQSAAQAIDQPSRAQDFLPWNLSFGYTHQDAEQDTPLVQVVFNPENATTTNFATPAASSTSTQAVFKALAEFITVQPELRDDLASLPATPPGNPNSTAATAVTAMASLVKDVADALTRADVAAARPPSATTYRYLLRKQQVASKLNTLTVDAVDPVTLQPTANPTDLWPEVSVTWLGALIPLTRRNQPTSLHAVYDYPAEPRIPANVACPYHFVFTWPDAGQVPTPPPPPTTGFTAPQCFQFVGTDVLSHRSALAGMSIVRNRILVNETLTAPAFVYRTPIVSFAAPAVASVTGTAPIVLRDAESSPGIASLGERIAKALGEFLHTLLWQRDSWQPDDRLPIRLAAGYSYPMATGTDQASLDTLVPILLVPTYDFNPTKDYHSDTGTFVRTVGDTVQNWHQAAQPPSGAIRFDITIYAHSTTAQPLIHAADLRYDLRSF
ncbi:MAG TPA: LysM peptidoglycan-binding domain-containing protein [Pseudonocardiaceae bacterium]|nr:LysM peptidoglycan-binding domain-containing protein [Pseudonocardiaceae bacterium]